MIFSKMPETVASEFIGDFTIKTGRLEEFSINRNFLKYIGGEELRKMISALMGKHWAIDAKAREMNEYISKGGFSQKDIIEKYDGLFGGEKLRFMQYGNATLMNFWNIYMKLAEITQNRKYLENLRTILQQFMLKESRETECDKDISRKLLKEITGIYEKLGFPEEAAEIGEKYREIMKNR